MTRTDPSSPPLIPEALCLATPTVEQIRAMSGDEKWEWIHNDPVKVAALRYKRAREHDAHYRPKVLALMAAGWTPEVPDHHDDMMSWAWRRPPRRKGSKGMRFASTDQAYNRLVRERDEAARA